jgi:hypothetical protein
MYTVNFTVEYLSGYYVDGYYVKLEGYYIGEFA